MSLLLKQRQKETLQEVIAKAQLNTGAGQDPMSGGGSAWGSEGSSSEPSFGNNNSSNNSNSAAPSGWKLLIYDDKGRDVIAPLLKVRELRDLGITLHMGIDKARQPVPGVPAIYLCEPTEANIQRIAKDASEELYQAFHLNFISQIPRRLLETLAESLVALPNIGHIRCFDRNLQYVAESNDLFHLLMQNSYFTLNSSTTPDTLMESTLNQTVLGICHVLQSQQVVPIIAHVAGAGAAQELAQRLNVAIGDLVREQLLPPHATAGRPVLFITDRSADLAAPLHHPMSYRGLLTDSLGMRLNKVDVEVKDDESKNAPGVTVDPITGKSMKSFEMDELTDQFYKHWAPLEFGKVGGLVDEAIKQWNQEKAELSADPTAAAAAASGGGDASADGEDNALSRMLATMPKMTEKKRSLDAHTILGINLLERIRGHTLDMFNGVEEQVLKREGLEESEVRECLTDKGTLADRQRFFLILYLLEKDDKAAEQIESKYLSLVASSQEASPSPTTTTAGGSAGAGTAPAQGSNKSAFPALDYIKQLRMWSKGTGGGDGDGAGGGAAAGWRALQSLATKVYKGDDFIFPLTRLVDALLQEPGKKGKLLEPVVGLDPRSKQTVDLASVRFTSCIVFSAGGGAIAELDELKVWESKHRGKAVAYGCSEMLTGESFLAQLNALGASQS